MKDRLDANAVASRSMGAEDNFWGVIDLVTMTDVGLQGRRRA